jgi:hypothetical protein
MEVNSIILVIGRVELVVSAPLIGGGGIGRLGILILFLRKCALLLFEASYEKKTSNANNKSGHMTRLTSRKVRSNHHSPRLFSYLWTQPIEFKGKNLLCNTDPPSQCTPVSPPDPFVPLSPPLPAE